MNFSRAQVTAAVTALGLNPHTTSSVVISRSTVYVETVALENGHPAIEYGALITEPSSTPITEEATE